MGLGDWVAEVSGLVGTWGTPWARARLPRTLGTGRNGSAETGRLGTPLVHCKLCDLRSKLHRAVSDQKTVDLPISS